MARALKGLTNQQSRAAESILPAARNVLAKAKLENHRQAVSNPQNLAQAVGRHRYRRVRSSLATAQAARPY